MKKTHLYLLAIIVATIGASGFIYKWKVLNFPIAPVSEAVVWDVQAHIEFNPKKGANRVVLQLPDTPPGFATLDEKFVARNFGMTIQDTKRGREVEWQIRRARGAQSLYYRASFYRDNHENAETAAPKPPKPDQIEEPYATARQALLEDIRSVSVDSATFAAQLIRRLKGGSKNQEVALLTENISSIDDRAKLTQSLLADRQIATRVLWGLELNKPGADVPLVPFLQVWDTETKDWHTINFTTGAVGLPENLLIWNAAGKPTLDVEDTPRARLTFTVQKALADALETAKQHLAAKSEKLIDYSLFSLPLQAQEVYRVLFMVPIGAFIMLLLRNFVGIKTFGTFMPVLIALAFRETSLIAGIVLFSTVVSLGLLVRFYLERLRLLLVPRLVCVLILVVLLMAFVSVVSNKLGIEVGLSVALFPMIIMTMTIERMSVAWEERGAGFAIKEGLGSMLIATIAYLAMSNNYVEHLVFVFPELLLVLFAFSLLFGRYSGYRLTELFRFRALARDMTKS